MYHTSRSEAANGDGFSAELFQDIPLKYTEIAETRQEHLAEDAPKPRCGAEFQEEDEDNDVRGTVAESGIDDEVFEIYRGNKIYTSFLTSAIKPGGDFEDLDQDSKEAQDWEEQQIAKGLSSSGIKASSSVRKAARQLREQRKMSFRPISLVSLDQALVAFDQEKRTLHSDIEILEERLRRCERIAAAVESEEKKICFLEDLKSFYRTFEEVSRKKMIRVAEIENLAKEKWLSGQLHELEKLEDEAAGILDDIPEEFRSFESASRPLDLFKEAYPIDYEREYNVNWLIELCELFVRVKYCCYYPKQDDDILDGAGIPKAVFKQAMCQYVVPRLLDLVRARKDPGQVALLQSKLEKSLGKNHPFVETETDAGLAWQ